MNRGLRLIVVAGALAFGMAALVACSEAKPPASGSSASYGAPSADNDDAGWFLGGLMLGNMMNGGRRDATVVNQYTHVTAHPAPARHAFKVNRAQAAYKAPSYRPVYSAPRPTYRPSYRASYRR